MRLTDSELAGLLELAANEGGGACAMDGITLDRIVAEIVERREADKIKSRDFIVYMLLWCPECSERHIDVGEFETKSHHTHACQHCGHVWRPAIGPTCGVQFLPGFKNEEPPR